MRVTGSPPFMMGMLDIDKLIKEQRIGEAEAIHIEYEGNYKKLRKFYRKWDKKRNESIERANSLL
ncbi:hypothetical protein KAR91_13170 [Candidatus Pacearchaeota archaeon]|nr:hypothetical protein [Candidatus Pacearchaeota archaeon]